MTTDWAGVAATGSAGMLRTGRWEADEPVELGWPAGWTISVLWPSTPPPLSPSQIAASLRSPVGTAALAELVRAKRRPLVVVDDLSRPTPTAAVLEPLLAELVTAGIPASEVTILVATGTHPPPTRQCLARKIGPTAAGACRVVAHVDSDPAVDLGRTRHGTPILVDRAVAEADVLIGIGGVYPNNTVGFGGGSKLALGVLARRSIAHLHESHHPVGWGVIDVTSTLRSDLDEIASAIGLTAVVAVHIDADARPVRITYGDGRVIHAAEAQWAAEVFRVAPPGDADVVVANAYPNDATLVSAIHKGYAPLRLARRDASRVLFASCHLGPGDHGLFPLVGGRTLGRRVRDKAAVMSPAQLVGALAGGFRRRLPGSRPSFAWPVALYRPGTGIRPEIPTVAGVQVTRSWSRLIEEIRAEQGARPLNVVVYPCAPLQVPTAVSPAGHAHWTQPVSTVKE